MKKFSWEFFCEQLIYAFVPQIFIQYLLCIRQLLGYSNRKKIFPSFYLYSSSRRQIIIKYKSKI